MNGLASERPNYSIFSINSPFVAQSAVEVVHKSRRSLGKYVRTAHLSHYLVFFLAFSSLGQQKSLAMSEINCNRELC